MAILRINPDYSFQKSDCDIIHRITVRIMKEKKMRFHILLLALLLTLVGCRQTTEPTAENISIEIALDTENPSIGDATLLVTVNTDEGNPVNDATVNARGDMTHAGMMPVIPDAVSEAEEGVYSIPFEFTMGGDWLITVDVTLANGDTASAEYEVDAVAGNADMDMDDMDMSSAVSGAYMSISNNGEDDVTLVSVSAVGVGMVQLHETVVDDNDMASMQDVEAGVTIPAGETVELVPGGLHAMLMNLENDLIEGETIALTLTFENGNTIEFDVPIVNMVMDDSETIESGDLSISGYWARPTALDDMHDMDMDDSEDSDMDMGEATEEAMDMDMDEATEEAMDMDMSEATEEADE